MSKIKGEENSSPFIMKIIPGKTRWFSSPSRRGIKGEVNSNNNQVRPGLPYK
jgi:hypothetical protein